MKILAKMSHFVRRMGARWGLIAPRVGVAVVVIHPRDGRVLQGYRINKDLGGGMWAFSGGHLEVFESLEHCAAREVREENNLGIRSLRVLGVTNNPYPDKGKHYLTVWMIGWAIAPEELRNMEPNKCSGWGWYSIDRMPSDLWEGASMLGAIKEAIVKGPCT